MENRHGLVVDSCLTQASGIAERETALAMATNLPPGATLGADKGYDTAAFVAGLRALGVTPHVAQNTTHRRSAIDGRTTRHGGYGVSQRKRKLVEEIFGWAKTIALLRKTRHRGVRRVGWPYRWDATSLGTPGRDYVGDTLEHEYARRAGMAPSGPGPCCGSVARTWTTR